MHRKTTRVSRYGSWTATAARASARVTYGAIHRIVIARQGSFARPHPDFNYTVQVVLSCRCKRIDLVQPSSASI